MSEVNLVCEERSLRLWETLREAETGDFIDSANDPEELAAILEMLQPFARQVEPSGLTAPVMWLGDA